MGEGGGGGVLLGWEGDGGDVGRQSSLCAATTTITISYSVKHQILSE